MRQTVSLKLIMGVLLVFLCVTVACKNKTTTIVTAEPKNGPAVQAAVNKAKQMLEQGEDIDVILTTLEDQLKSDPRVYDVALESETGMVSVSFIDGESHTFMLSDAQKGDDDLSTSTSDVGSDLESTNMDTDVNKTPLYLRQTADADYYANISQLSLSPMQNYYRYRMPANNKALLANSLIYWTGKNPKYIICDSTELIEKMLSARGYKPDRKNIVIKTFDDIAQYGVIVIETHAGGRDLEYPQELMGKENCGGPFSKYSLLTTEKATSSTIAQYASDIFCGRLTLWDILSLDLEGKVIKEQYFGVTPNYIRDRNKGKFPDNTLMLLSSCRAYRDDLSSPMRDMLFEKCNKGAQFLGWTGSVRAKVALRAALNLFQLMTVSNEEKIIENVPAKWAEFKDQLKKSTPPQGGYFTYLEKALDELNKKSYLTDIKTKSELKPSFQDDELPNLILMPHPLYARWFGYGWKTGSGEALLPELYMFFESQPTVTIGGTEVTVTPEPYMWFGRLSSVPVGTYGDIVLSEGERTSISRPLHRWRPQISVQGSCSPDSFQFMTFTATFTLNARSTIDANSGLRDSIWNDPPPAAFYAYWDYDASNIVWKVEGEGMDSAGNYHKYEGSGLRQFGVMSDGSPMDDGFMQSTDGTQVSLSIESRIPWTETETYPDGSSSTTNHEFTMKIKINNIALSDDWTVSGGSVLRFEDDDVLCDDMSQISWNAFPAEPPFDPENEPR